MSRAPRGANHNRVPATAEGAALDYRDHARTVAWVAHKLAAKARARGLGVGFDDLHQECAILWLNCRDRFDPAQGKFSTYFLRSAMLAFPMLVRNIRKGRGAGEVSLEEAGYKNSKGQGLDHASVESAAARVPDDALDPEARLARKEAVREAVRNNPLLRRMVVLSVRTPAVLEAQLAALRAQVEHARGMGVEMEPAATRMTPALLRKIFGFNWRERMLMQIEDVAA